NAKPCTVLAQPARSWRRSTASCSAAIPGPRVCTPVLPEPETPSPRHGQRPWIHSGSPSRYRRFACRGKGKPCGSGRRARHAPVPGGKRLAAVRTHADARAAGELRRQQQLRLVSAAAGGPARVMLCSPMDLCMDKAHSDPAWDQRQLQDMLANVLDHVGAAIYMKDVDGCYRYGNRMTFEHFGLP